MFLANGEITTKVKIEAKTESDVEIVKTGAVARMVWGGGKHPQLTCFFFAARLVAIISISSTSLKLVFSQVKHK